MAGDMIFGDKATAMFIHRLTKFNTFVSANT